MDPLDEEASDSTPGIVLSIDALSADALRGLVEEFVTRDGTDYGRVERSTAEKIEDVLDRLRTGEAHIVFDPDTESANIVSATEVESA